MKNLNYLVHHYYLFYFENIGFSLFTCRNGNINKSSSKKYAEKYIMIKQNQEFPFHFHWQKTEDIINRGGGTLLITVYNDDNGNLPTCS